ncbi:MAG: penicillin acylase family protein [Flavobacteriaceae bacterium]
MKNHLFIGLLLAPILTLFGQINPQNIEIVRDAYGVPHIYAKTDAEVAYGLAWAHAEDDFETIQLGFLAGDAKLSKAIGLKGAPADFLQQFIKAEEIAREQVHTLSDEFMQVVKGYAEGLNAYAASHKEEVLLDELFPISPIQMIAYSQLQLFVSNAADRLVSQILKNKVPGELPVEAESNGSNLIALSSAKTGEKASYLTINTHQPLEGPTSWYEAHLVSEEGTNIIGALFPGAPCVLTGANEYLGWTHTVNFQDKADIFKLEVTDKKTLTYKVDDDLLTLEKHKAKVYFKFLGLRIGINRPFYSSIYGPTLKNSKGFYAVRTPSTTTVRALEQWWRMNKAQSFSEFYSALKMNALPGYNIGYADKNDTIFYISNGKMPIRAEGYNWKGLVPGNTYETLWDSYYDTEDLPQVIQPKSGYVYNANHSPFKSSAAADNPDASDYPISMGYERYDNNRSTRLYNLLEANKTIDFQKLKEIKYDHTLPDPLNYNYVNLNALFDMDPADYPGVGGLLRKIQSWDRVAAADSKGAAAYAILYYQLRRYWAKLGEDKTFDRATLHKGLKRTSRYMNRHFKSQDIVLGDFQKLVRGDKNIPIWGLPDVVTAMHGAPYKDGRYRITNGESYIALIQFREEETRYQSVISYGNSNRKSSLHYDDQMKLYQNFQTKPMSFDRDDVLQNAVRRYAPMIND